VKRFMGLEFLEAKDLLTVETLYLVTVKHLEDNA
jgi:hypothetical protein